jgi:hypothetical protein
VKDEGEAPAITVTGSNGVQVGAGSTQHNHWGPKQPLDPLALSALNPHIAVGRLVRESHNELVDFFVRDQPMVDLPEAAEAIAREAARLRWADPGPLELFMEGFARKYSEGHVFRSPSHGVAKGETPAHTPTDDEIVTVAPGIWNYYDELGGERSWLGFPLSNSRLASTGPTESSSSRKAR